MGLYREDAPTGADDGGESAFTVPTAPDFVRFSLAP